MPPVSHKNRVKQILKDDGGWMTISQIIDKWSIRKPTKQQITSLVVKTPGIVQRAPNGKSYENKEYAWRPTS